MLGGSGTFASMDLFPGRPFEPWTLHRYLYADANPVNKIDPTGYQGELTNFTIASAITIIIAGTIIGYAYTGTVKGGLLGAAAGTGIAVALLSRSPELFRRTLMGGFINAFWYRVGLSVREYLGSPLPPHYEETVLQAFIAGELSGVFSWKAADYFSPETAQYLGGIVNAGLTSLLTGKCLRDAIYGAFLSIPASAFKNMIFSDFAVPLFQVPFDAESWFKIAMDEAFKSISSLIKPPLLEAIRAWKPEMATAIECK